MIINLKQIMKSKTVVNGSWLYLLQIFNTIVPLLTLPYITRVLGSTQYGLFSFSLNIISYFQVLVEYGFNLSGSRQIANLEKSESVDNIYSSIMSSKIVLCCISIILLSVILVLGNLDKEQTRIILILFSVVIGSTIQQIWLFQGLQQMKYITIINVITRSISVLLVFLLVKNNNDIYLYSILFSFTTLGNGIFNYYVVKKKLNISFKFASLQKIKKELQNGWYVFTTDAMSKVFSSFGLTILGITSSRSDVGMYAAIQKIPIMLSMMFAPLSQAIYPVVTKLFNSDFDIGIKFVKKIAKIVIPIVAMIVLVISIFSEEIIILIYGNSYSDMHIILIPLVMWMFFGIVNNFLGIQILVASGHQKEYSSAFRIGVLSLVTINIIFGNIFGIYGISLAAFCSEVLLTMALIVQIKKIII